MTVQKQIVRHAEVPTIDVIIDDKLVTVKAQIRKNHAFADVPEKAEPRAGDTVRYIVWEEGGGYSNTGDATIIAGADGSKLRPVYIRRSGHLAGKQHAAFAVRAGEEVVIIHATHHRYDFRVRIYTALATEKKLEIKQIWDAEGDPATIKAAIPETMEKYRAAIIAAMKKATCYHCREPHYADIAGGVTHPAYSLF